MICTLITGQTSKEGIFMRYSYEFKMKCIEMYRKGIVPDIPEGISRHRFLKYIRVWTRTVEAKGSEVLRHKPQNKYWSPEEKFELVSKVLAGNSIQCVSINAGINYGMLYQWVRNYKNWGYNGLIVNTRGRKPKEPKMKNKITKPEELNESEREELIRLRAEIEYIKAENEVIKKEIALRQEKQAAQLKAKKQQSLKNLEKKGIS